MGRGHIGYEGTRLLAVCDVDTTHLERRARDGRPGREGLRRLPRGAAAARHRRRPHRHAAALARPDVGGGRARRQGHLVREADDAHHRRGQARRRGSEPLRAHVPREHVVPLQGPVLRHGHRGAAAQEDRAERRARLAAHRDGQRQHGLRLEVLLERAARIWCRSRCRRSWTTTCGSAPRRASPTTPTACTGTSAATGTTTAAAWATWASTTSTRCSTSSTRTTRARFAWTWTRRSSTTTPPGRGAASSSRTPTAAGSSSTARTATPARPYIAGPLGNIYRGFRSDVPRLQELLATLPDPEPQITTFCESVRTRRKFTLNEYERAPIRHAGEPRRDRRAPEPHAPLRPGAAALPRRRGGEPADRSADARAVGAVMKTCHDDQTHRACLARPLGLLVALLCVASRRLAIAQRRARPRPSPPPDILAKFPAASPAQRDRLAGQLLALGEPGIAEVTRRLVGYRRRPRHQRALRLERRGRRGPAGSAARRSAPQPSARSSARWRSAQDVEVRTFLLSQLQLVGRDPAVQAAAPLLADAALVEPATQLHAGGEGPRRDVAPWLARSARPPARPASPS